MAERSQEPRVLDLIVKSSSTDHSPNQLIFQGSLRPSSAKIVATSENRMLIAISDVSWRAASANNGGDASTTTATTPQNERAFDRILKRLRAESDGQDDGQDEVDHSAKFLATIAPPVDVIAEARSSLKRAREAEPQCGTFAKLRATERHPDDSSDSDLEL